MKNRKTVKTKYDPEADVLSWEISRSKKIDYATEVGNMIVHFSKNNLPVLVEIIGASRFLKKSERAMEKARDLAFSH